MVLWLNPETSPEGSVMNTPVLLTKASSDNPPTPPVPEPSVDTTKKEAPGPGKKPGPVKATLPKLPHERDESVDDTPAAPSEHGRQAYRDLARGLQDTDRGPPADQAYKKQKSARK
jgi:hypothetical protein